MQIIDITDAARDGYERMSAHATAEKAIECLQCILDSATAPLRSEVERLKKREEQQESLVAHIRSRLDAMVRALGKCEDYFVARNLGAGANALLHGDIRPALSEPTADTQPESEVKPCPNFANTECDTKTVTLPDANTPSRPASKGASVVPSDDAPELDIRTMNCGHCGKLLDLCECHLRTGAPAPSPAPACETATATPECDNHPFGDSNYDKEFAERLERELSAALAERDRALAIYQEANGLRYDAEVARDAALRELATYKEAFGSAKRYIDANVCDPDTTAEMWDKYQAYETAKAALDSALSREVT